MGEEKIFQYRRLPPTHMRLLLIAPADKPELEVTGSLVTRHILQCGQDRWRYNALSYTWGDATDTTRIRLRDDSWNQEGWLTVTTSVVAALSRFPHPTAIMAFWVDQICIDQSSTAEKEDQIGFMKIIYERAGSIYAWLGPSADQSDVAIAILNRGDWNQDPRKILRGEDLAELASVPLDHDLRKQLSAGFVKAIAALLRRPYWTRAWIIQELTAQTAAQTAVCCGEAQVQLSKVLWFAVAIRHTLLLPSDEQAALRPLHNVGFIPKLRAFRELRKQFPKRPILELLTNLRGTCATDPRDHIYSMLGFAVEIPRIGEGYRPDYSVSAYDAFVSFAVWHIQQSRSLDILAYYSPITQIFPKSTYMTGQTFTTVGSVTNDCSVDTNIAYDSLPFWVPDWRVDLPIDILPRREIPNDPSSKLLYDASGVVLPAFSISEQNRAQVEALAVSGVRLASLSSVNGCLLGDGDFTEQAETLWAPVDPNAKCPLTGLDMFTVFKHTIFGDLKAMDVGHGNTQGWRRTGQDEGYDWPMKPLTDASVGRETYPEVVTMRRICSARRPFYTKAAAGSGDSILGLGPAWVQADDELWILKGAKFPLLLRRGAVTEHLTTIVIDTGAGKLIERKKAPGEAAYKIVGECIVLGLMDGQVLEMLGNNPVRPPPPPLAGMDREFRQIDLY